MQEERDWATKMALGGLGTKISLSITKNARQIQMCANWNGCSFWLKPSRYKNLCNEGSSRVIHSSLKTEDTRIPTWNCDNTWQLSIRNNPMFISLSLMSKNHWRQLVCPSTCLYTFEKDQKTCFHQILGKPTWKVWALCANHIYWGVFHCFHQFKLKLSYLTSFLFNTPKSPYVIKYVYQKFVICTNKLMHQARINQFGVHHFKPLKTFLKPRQKGPQLNLPEPPHLPSCACLWGRSLDGVRHAGGEKHRHGRQSVIATGRQHQAEQSRSVTNLEMFRK